MIGRMVEIFQKLPCQVGADSQSYVPGGTVQILRTCWWYEFKIQYHYTLQVLFTPLHTLFTRTTKPNNNSKQTHKNFETEND